jgi:hypothetical protein
MSFQRLDLNVLDEPAKIAVIGSLFQDSQWPRRPYPARNRFWIVLHKSSRLQVLCELSASPEKHLCAVCLKYSASLFHS